MLDGAMTADAYRAQVHEAPGERLVDLRINARLAAAAGVQLTRFEGLNA
ncbi:hypothetical protein [Actinomadura sp. HBU206391]|nr:hypothetical protein [Actinomadura sp. HBU206391]MBC6463810.1 hypothetical protein [Actinomadura sp. HBU206391]